MTIRREQPTAGCQYQSKNLRVRSGSLLRLCSQKCWLPVTTGVVQSATSPHRLKVIDAPSHERNSSPEDGKNPDNARHGQSGAPEEFLSWIPRQILSVKE